MFTISNIQNKMPDSSSSLFYLSILLSLTVFIKITHSATSEPTEINVGGKGGWQIPDNNDTSFNTCWAADIRFHVGDTLSFVCHNDSVMVVDKFAYYHCNTSNPIYIFSDKVKTLIKLDRSGSFYFLISGAPDHCKNGERLEIDVMSDSPPRPDDDSPASAPSSAKSSNTMHFAVLAFTGAAGVVFHF